MLATAKSAALIGVEAREVHVEVDLSRGLPAFAIVGLPDASVKESRDRVRAAFQNAGFKFPEGRVTVNLAPAEVRKAGPAYDLPIALAILAAMEVVPPQALETMLCAGELALDGRIRRVHGTLSMGLTAMKRGWQGLLPRANLSEAMMVDGWEIYAVETLMEAVQVLRGEGKVEKAVGRPHHHLQVEFRDEVDFSDVRGQEHAKRALEIAAAGGHNVLMIGTPGAGKTMLAQRLPTILPELTIHEAIEVARIQSVAGVSPQGVLQLQRPFRSPHHTISNVALVGGGTVPRPGEVSLAHLGVLFLDEFPEFRQDVLETLRQPMEDGVVTVSRAAGSLTFPAQFTLVAAMNPCPCGYYGDARRPCQCREGQIHRYRAKLSGPLVDRIDLHVEVPPVGYSDLAGAPDGERSSAIRARVRKAWERQRRRYGAAGPRCNARLTSAQLRQWVKVKAEGEAVLKTAVERLGLSARAVDRVLKVARTIADLEGCEDVSPSHLAEAVQYRVLDRVG